MKIGKTNRPVLIALGVLLIIVVAVAAIAVAVRFGPGSASSDSDWVKEREKRLDALIAKARAELPNPAERVEEADAKAMDGQLEDPHVMVVEPGTEILFELNHPVKPNVDESFNDLSMEFGGPAPVPPPSDGKWSPKEHGPSCRWNTCAGGGVVWATDRNILFVSPSTPGFFVDLQLYPGYSMPTSDPAFRLTIVTSGGKEPVSKLMECRGCRIDGACRHPWWGYGGGIRLRPVQWRKAPSELHWGFIREVSTPSARRKGGGSD